MTRPRPQRDRGVALLDAVVALFLVAVIGTAALSASTESASLLRESVRAEAEIREAAAFLHSVALWSRQTLDLRLGTRRQGPWWLQIERPDDGVYALALLDSTRRTVLLRTEVYVGFRRQP